MLSASGNLTHASPLYSHYGRPRSHKVLGVAKLLLPSTAKEKQGKKNTFLHSLSGVGDWNY